MTPPRIGCVPYLNARPLIQGLDHIELLPPSILSEKFLAGHYDAALIPIFTTLQIPHPHLLEGCSISCKGPVLSVLIAHQKPLPQIKTISRDPHSRTSNALAQILLPHIAPSASLLDGPAEARIVIGDPALQLRSAHPELSFTDLGASWFQLTRLPFVFAAWCLSPDAPAHLPNTLRQAAKRGIKSIPAIANSHPNPTMALRYLSHHIRYILHNEEKSAIQEFARHLLSLSLLKNIPHIHWI